MFGTKSSLCHKSLILWGFSTSLEALLSALAFQSSPIQSSPISPRNLDGGISLLFGEEKIHKARSALVIAT